MTPKPSEIALLPSNRNAIVFRGLIMKPVEDFGVFNGFSCVRPGDKDKDIDDFIQDDAHRYFKDKVAVTYGLFFNARGWKTRCPLGFATLQNDTIEIPVKDYYPNMPAVKIGRFGIRLELQRRKVGSTFLYMIYEFMRQANNRTGCRYLTLNTYQPVVKFYEENNFIVFDGKPGKPRPTKQLIMYLDLLSESIHRWPPDTK